MSKTGEELRDGLNIGDKMYAVHSRYIDEKLNMGEVKICRVKTFENKKGKIQPVLTVVGASRVTVCPESHYIYRDIDEAVKAIYHGQD